MGLAGAADGRAPLREAVFAARFNAPVQAVRPGRRPRSTRSRWAPGTFDLAGAGGTEDGNESGDLDYRARQRPEESAPAPASP